MQVEGVNPGRKVGWQNVEKTAETEEIQEQQQGSGETAEVDGEQSVETEAQGVLRLLQEGHFKGVADVRLRINFYDELAGIQASAVDATAGEKINGIMGGIGGAVNSFVEGNELTEEQAAGVQAAQENFVGAANATGENPAVDLTAAFEAFIAALQNLFTQASSETPPEEPAAPPEGSGEAPSEGGGEEPAVEGEGGEPEMTPAAAGAESGVNWPGFIENLRTTFAAGMAELTDAISGVSALPPLSEPKGNGVAYDKFLAIYNQMSGAEPAGGGLNEAEPT